MTGDYTSHQQLPRRPRPPDVVTKLDPSALGTEAVMKVKISYQINGLEVFRYSITELRNESFRYQHPSAPASPIATMAITYAQLQDSHSERIIRESTSANAQQILRNHMTAIRGFQRWLGKSDTSPVGDELSANHTESIKRHLASLELSERSKSDRRSMLNAVRQTLESIRESPTTPVRGRERSAASITPLTLTPFERGLREALKRAGFTPKSAALTAGVSPSALGRWSRGALPNTRSERTLHKLDSTLNLPEGHLAGLLEETLARQAPVAGNAFRECLAARVADSYFLKPRNLLPHFKEQWEQLLRYKTEVLPGSKVRSKNGRWNKTAPATSASAIPGVTVFNGAHFASAALLWTHVSSYLGYMARPPEKGGAGLSAPSSQTLAWLAVPEKLEKYLLFLEARSRGLRHTGQEVFCTSLISLLQERHGYLAQTPELLGDLPESVVQGRTWDALCAQARQVLTNWKASCTDLSRDPSEPIQFLLDQPAPLEPVFQAMQRLHAIASGAPGGGRDEATARRDELLLGLLVSNPLRRKNLQELTYRDDNSGSIYRNSTGQWRIRLPRSAFKNQKSKRRSRNTTYDVAVAPWLHSLLNDYVAHFRPVLAMGRSTANLFLTRTGCPMNDMTHRVLELTREHIPGCGGFGPHAFRHLVATDWLRRNPGDYMRVAELLNDSIEVVLNTYAHLKTDETLVQHSEQLEHYLPRHLRSHP